MDNETLLASLNNFTRREHTADEVYLFTVILCDNEIDRDLEKFTVPALHKLSELFIGKTGIFDHNAKGANQTARIFGAQVLEDAQRTTSDGEVYTYLKADAYMVRTSSNEDLIKEIDGGIKKEVSVSCSAESQKCSICGANGKKKVCTHVKGKQYGGKKCFVLLDESSDAYEWSFVAVPAQVGAGITKFFNGGASVVPTENDTHAEVLQKIFDETKAEVIRLGFLSRMPVKALQSVTEKMSLEELYALKTELNKQVRGEIKPQLAPFQENPIQPFKMGKEAPFEH